MTNFAAHERIMSKDVLSLPAVLPDSPVLSHRDMGNFVNLFYKKLEFYKWLVTYGYITVTRAIELAS